LQKYRRIVIAFSVVIFYRRAPQARSLWWQKLLGLMSKE
jgi:hypothetical protein